MLKDEKEYIEKYGHIPSNRLERFIYLVKKLNIKRGIDKLFEEMHRINNIKWKRLDIVISLEPKATPRARSNRKMNVFYVKGASNNRKRFRKFMNNIGHDMIITPIKFKCDIYVNISSGMSKIEKLLAELGFIRPINRPDWDNFGKTYSDMVQEQLILDDSLIIEGTVRKFYSCKPGVEISIEYMEDFDSKFNKDRIYSYKNNNVKDVEGSV